MVRTYMFFETLVLYTNYYTNGPIKAAHYKIFTI